MTTRLLPREDWCRLVGTELEPVWPVLPPDAQVLIVEDQGAIVACWALYRLVHLEGCWIHPDHRGKGSVARRLLAGMRRTAQAMGARAVNTASVQADVSAMLTKLGAVRLGGAHFALNVED
jgi:hypothetical protein